MTAATVSRAVPAPLKRPVKRVLRRWYEGRSRSRPPSLTILMLHEVHPLGFTPGEFKGLLEHLGRGSAFARLDEVCGALRAGRELTRDTIVLTFDDGLRNNYTYARPLLERYRAKATFFVVPGLIEDRRWLWTHETVTRLHSTPIDQLSRLAEFRAWTQVPVNDPDRHAWARGVVDSMKRMAEPERRHLIETLRRIDPTLLDRHPQRDRYELMDWDELLTLDPDLIEIGCHSYSHPILEGLPPLLLEQEIKVSRDALAANMGRAIVSFCYPDGRFDDGALGWVRRHYLQAVTADDGTFDPQGDLHRLPRKFVSDAVDTLYRIARTRYRSMRGSR